MTEATAPAETTPAPATPAPTTTTSAPTAATPAPAPATTAPAAAAPTPAATTPAPTPAPTGLASGKAAETPPGQTIPADWPADWREKLAGDDKAFLNTLKRYASPLEMGKWTRGLQLRMSAGELKPALPDNATPEQLAEHRKAHGLPEAVETYTKDIKLSDGLVPGEADKPILADFAKVAHAKGWTQGQYNDALDFYFGQQQAAANARAAGDKEFEIASTVSLRQEMGADFDRNMRALGAFWRNEPPEVMSAMLAARLPNGQVLGNDPTITKWLLGKVAELDPMHMVMPAGGTPGAATIIARKGEIEKLMGDHSSDYWRGPKDPQTGETLMQKEFREITEAERRQAQRAA